MSGHPRSAEPFTRGRRVMPGGNTRASTFETPHPISLVLIRGSHLRAGSLPRAGLPSCE